MNSAWSRFTYMFAGNWAPNRAAFWVWKWATLMAILLPWTWLSTQLWNDQSMWKTYGDLAGFATFAVIICAIYFEKWMLPENLQKPATQS